MITKTKICISISPWIIKQINKESRQKKQSVSRTIEEMLVSYFQICKEIKPQIQEVKKYIEILKKELRLRENAKKK